MRKNFILDQIIDVLRKHGEPMSLYDIRASLWRRDFKYTTAELSNLLQSTKEGKYRNITLKDGLWSCSSDQTVDPNPENIESDECIQKGLILKFPKTGIALPQKMQRTSNVVNDQEVFDRIDKLIAAEKKNEPYSDEQLRICLQLEGLKVARRTITKYRIKKNIPNSILRKQTDVDSISTRISELIGTENKESPYSDSSIHRMLKSEGYTISSAQIRKIRDDLGFPSAKYRQVIPLQTMIELASRKGGTCLATTNGVGTELLTWRCCEGHEWLATIQSIEAGGWCSQCKKVSNSG